jgi:hypothetical protein
MGGIVGIIGEQSTIKRQESGERPTTSVTLPQHTQFRRNVVCHPELRKLRLILTCDYGRPKFIKFLFRVVPVCVEILTEHQTNATDFMANFDITDDLHENLSEISTTDAAVDLPVQLLVNGCLLSILILVGITYFDSFISSPEGEDWVRYQQLLTNTNHAENAYHENSNSMSESTRELSQARSHALVQLVNYDEIIAFMNQPLWLLTLARSLESLPFPISIHGTREMQVNDHSVAFPLLYANLAYLEMSGFTKRQLIGTEHNHLDESPEIISSGSLLIANALKAGTKLRIGRMNQRSNGQKFQNFMTFKPLCDMKNSYLFMIIVHCDLTKRGSDEEYLHKINLFAETILPSKTFCSELDSSSLSSYFYQPQEGG